MAVKRQGWRCSWLLHKKGRVCFQGLEEGVVLRLGTFKKVTQILVSLSAGGT